VKDLELSFVGLEDLRTGIAYGFRGIGDSALAVLNGPHQSYETLPRKIVEILYWKLSETVRNADVFGHLQSGDVNDRFCGTALHRLGVFDPPVSIRQKENGDESRH